MKDFPRVLVTSGPWRQDRWEERSAHLKERGIPHELFVGLDTDRMHLTAVDRFPIDGHPDYHIGNKEVVCCLRYYVMWRAMTYMPEDAFMTMDDDAVFPENWREQWDSAMAVLPDDWDIVSVGCCCCTGRPTEHIGNNLYEVKYPLCNHVMMVRKKALPVLLDVHQRIWAPLDIAMFYDSMPKLRVYTIFPRLAEQKNVTLYP